MTSRRLDVDRVLATAERLEQRIAERFPESGLHRVAVELVGVAREGAARIQGLARPIWPLRVAAILGIASILVIAIGMVVFSLGLSRDMGSRADLLQTVPAVADEVVLVGVAVFFLLTLENRMRRTQALRALYELRSLAHVIDMHQLTKDPDRVLNVEATTTVSSPQRITSRFELGRYLDYCSEMLSITSKMAALHIEGLRDPVVLGAVRDIESLVGTLSGKIWQKMMILDLVRTGGPSITPGHADAFAPAVAGGGLAATKTPAALGAGRDLRTERTQDS